MTHTEGAWYTKRQEDLDPNGNGYVWAIKGRRLSDEKDSNGGWKHYVQNPAYANSEANARLIASAPDLLAIVQFIAREHRDGAQEVYFGALFSDDDITTLGDAVTTAIAKAEEVTA